MADAINRILTWLFDLAGRPLAALPAAVSLTIWSVLVGVLMLLAFARLSDQEGLRRAKGRVQAELIALRLFQNDVRVFLRTQWRILAETGTYLRYSLKPILFLLLPLILILIQMNFRYGYRPLRVGETALLKITVLDDKLLAYPEGITIATTGDALAVETRGVRIPAQHEISWRVRAMQAGEHTVSIAAGVDTLTKRVVIGDYAGLVTPMRTGRGFVPALLYPGESQIPGDSIIDTVSITYPDEEIDIFGWRMYWLIPFLVISIVAGFALKGVFRVQI